MLILETKIYRSDVSNISVQGVQKGSLRPFFNDIAKTYSPLFSYLIRCKRIHWKIITIQYCTRSCCQKFHEMKFYSVIKYTKRLQQKLFKKDDNNCKKNSTIWINNDKIDGGTVFQNNFSIRIYTERAALSILRLKFLT